MKNGQSVKYTTAQGNTYTITKESENEYSYDFDCDRTLEAAKASLDYLDDPNRS